jgi:hypothetical protein
MSEGLYGPWAIKFLRAVQKATTYIVLTDLLSTAPLVTLVQPEAWWCDTIVLDKLLHMVTSEPLNLCITNSSVYGASRRIENSGKICLCVPAREDASPSVNGQGDTTVTGKTC